MRRRARRRGRAGSGREGLVRAESGSFGRRHDGAEVIGGDGFQARSRGRGRSAGRTARQEGCRRLRAAVNYHDCSPDPGSKECFSRRAALVGAQENAFAGCAECQDPVDARGDQVLDHRSDRLQIHRVPTLP